MPLRKIETIFKEMVSNYNNGKGWKNIPLAKDAFSRIVSFPDISEGELNTDADKALWLCRMLDNYIETDTPRFSIEVREYILKLNATDEENLRRLTQLRDYIDVELPMAEYCRRYGRLLKFDPIERTELWEEIIYKVESLCNKKLGLIPRRMGFCFAYWSTKSDILKRKFGVDWRSPHIMNPHVMFD